MGNGTGTGKPGFFASGSVTGSSKTCVHDVGSGPAILVLHDLADSGPWFPLVERLQPRYRVIAPELPAIASVDATATMITATLADRRLSRLHAIVGVGVGAYRALHLALWRGVAVETLVLLGGMLTVPELAALGPVPNLRVLLSRLAAQVYLRVGEHGERADSEVIAATTGARVDVVRGCGPALLANDTAATLAAVVAAIDQAVTDLDEPPPRMSFRAPTE